MIWFRKRHLIYFVILILLTWISMDLTNFDLSKFIQLENMISFIQRSFIPPDWSILPFLLRESFVTLGMAFLGTVFALLIGIPLSFAAAHNTSRHYFSYQSVRFFLSGLRSVPEIVFGLIFVVVIGLGPFAAVLAILLHNIGVLGKLISELIEAADKGPQEAMKSVGATHRIGNLFSIIPQIWPNVLSHYFYRFEVAIRTSLVLGFVGGGGLGQQIFNQYQSFYYDGMAVSIIVIMVLVICVDMFGSYVRKRII
ncbi:phosphonate ABC transporter, permease protein PhnE [Evansella sp. AB-P1]|uniref:phosphonate ABC transporter, permease protein PhnE n=1 Tax=Evansella sp. AB-P1 TaxID=3037653 RepID=UPI00241CC3A4|nr:phosphonate ABC transporter, permease protein PhnE [Evansella sp. AB-P1]MDG5787254.1 phosphonate ABC transporter, permease protein PhnE [Evansella sp. AB-P1]